MLLYSSLAEDVDVFLYLSSFHLSACFKAYGDVSTELPGAGWLKEPGPGPNRTYIVLMAMRE